MKKNKEHSVCHLTSVHPAYDIRIFYKECVSLVKSGYNVVLIATNTFNHNKGGVKVVDINLPKQRFFRMLLVPFLMFIKALKEKATLYHFHDPELMLCGLLLRLFGKKVVFDVHENVRLSIQSKAWLPFWSRGILSFLYFCFERVALLFFNQLILAEDSYSKYYPSIRSTVVLNYPLLLASPDLPKDYSLPLRLVYSGVVHELRGIWEMLFVAKILVDKGCNIQLNIVGELRPTSLKQQVEDYLFENKLHEKVFLHGKVDFSDVASYLKDAHIGLSLLKPIANYKESLPTKIFEYMQHGIPVVTNNFPLYKEYVENNQVGICVDVNNVQAIGDKLEELLSDIDALNIMSENAVQCVKKSYNWNSQEEKLVNVYSNLLN